MNLKKLNETKIYDNLTQPEKAQLLFKAIPEQDGSTFDKVINSGERKSWTVRNHKARQDLENMMLVALCWGVDYWKNQATMGGELAISQSKNIEKADQAMVSFVESLIANHAYILILDKLEVEHGLDKKTVLSLSGVGCKGVTRESFAKVMPNNTKLLEQAEQTLYERYSKTLNGLLN